MVRGPDLLVMGVIAAPDAARGILDNPDAR